MKDFSHCVFHFLSRKFFGQARQHDGVVRNILLGIELLTHVLVFKQLWVLGDLTHIRLLFMLTVSEVIKFFILFQNMFFEHILMDVEFVHVLKNQVGHHSDYCDHCVNED